jgi:cobalamin biosynthesis Mg chelatase CobN
LPTGRNFSAIDPRVIPTPDFLVLRQGLADLLLERYPQEQASIRASWRLWGGQLPVCARPVMTSRKPYQ